MRTRAALASIVAAAALLPLCASAETGKPGFAGLRGAGGPRLFLVLRIADELGLSDEKALTVSHILKQGEEKRDELRRKRWDLEKQIREALAKTKPDPAELTKLVDQSVELHRQQEQIADDSFTALKKVLTIEEQAKLVLLRSRLRREFGFHSSGPKDREGRWGRHGHRGSGGGSGPADDDGAPSCDHEPEGPEPNDAEG